MAENKLENSLKIAIGQSVNKCFEAVDITPENIMIEIPKDSTHGDYSTNIAMQLTNRFYRLVAVGLGSTCDSHCWFT